MALQAAATDPRAEEAGVVAGAAGARVGVAGAAAIAAKAAKAVAVAVAEAEVGTEVEAVRRAWTRRQRAW